MISVKETCNVLCAMSAFIILFSVIISLLEEKLKCSNLLKSVIFGFIEVTNGCIYSANEISLSSILITSIICSFGGLCVMLQIFSICNDAKISIKPLIFSRILHTILSFIYTFLLILIIPISSKQTFISNTSSANASFVTSPIPALLLLVCCFCFPIYISRQKNL